MAIGKEEDYTANSIKYSQLGQHAGGTGAFK